MYVEVKGDTERDFQSALAEFKRKVKKEEILDEFRKREYYLKPSVKRKRKRNEAKRRRIREEKEQKQNY